MQSLQLGVEDPSFVLGDDEKNHPVFDRGKIRKVFAGPTKKMFFVGRRLEMFSKKASCYCCEDYFEQLLATNLLSIKYSPESLSTSPLQTSNFEASWESST